MESKRIQNQWFTLRCTKTRRKREANETRLLSLQEKELFSRANTLGNTLVPSKKIISEKVLPSIVVVLSRIRKTQFPMNCRRNNYIFNSNTVGNGINCPRKFLWNWKITYFQLHIALGNTKKAVENVHSFFSIFPLFILF